MKKFKNLVFVLFVIFLLNGCSELDIGKEIEKLPFSTEEVVEITESGIENINELKNGIEEVADSLNEGSTSIDSQYPTYTAYIKKVSDGDTITITRDGKEQKVRLLLVDTPESVKPGVDPQPFSIEASNFVKELLPVGKEIIVEPGVEGSEYDKYDRLLAYVYVDGKMLNETLVKKGFARVGYIYKPNTRYLDELEAAQQEAKDAKKGIWSIEGYVTDKGYNTN